MIFLQPIGSVLLNRVATASLHESPLPHLPLRTICCHSSVAATYARSYAALFAAMILLSFASCVVLRRKPFWGTPRAVAVVSMGSVAGSTASAAGWLSRSEAMSLQRTLVGLLATRVHSSGTNVLDPCFTTGAATSFPRCAGGHTICHLWQQLLRCQTNFSARITCGARGPCAGEGACTMLTAFCTFGSTGGAIGSSASKWKTCTRRCGCQSSLHGC